MTCEQSEVFPKPHCGVRELFHRKEIFTQHHDRQGQEVRHTDIQAHSKAYTSAWRRSHGSLQEVMKAQGTWIILLPHCCDQICEQAKRRDLFWFIVWTGLVCTHLVPALGQNMVADEVCMVDGQRRMLVLGLLLKKFWLCHQPFANYIQGGYLVSPLWSQDHKHSRKCVSSISQGSLCPAMQTVTVNHYRTQA